MTNLDLESGTYTTKLILKVYLRKKLDYVWGGI